MSVKWYGDKLVSRAEERIEKNLEAVGTFLAGAMRGYIHRPPKTGRIYFKRRGSKEKRGKIKGGWGALSQYIAHQASAPGESPATDTGILANSITYEVGRTGHKIYCKVGTSLKYGYWLEYGTKNIKPRPFARRALVEHEKKIIRILAKELV